MPDRIIRQKILSSDSVNQLSWAAEVFYRRLFSIVDDFGRFDARPSIIRAAAYPLKLDKVSDADVVKWMGECSKAGLVSVYQVETKDYLEVLKFGQRLRAMKSQYPPPNSGKQLSPADIRGHLTAEADIGCQTLQEGKRYESESESEGEEMRTLAECLEIALKDPRWLKANSTNQNELQTFCNLLEKRAQYEKNPGDFKSHFANWKMNGKKEADLKQENKPKHMQSTGGPTLKTI